MFVSGFNVELPSARARFRQDELRGGDLMVQHMQQTGAIVDEALCRPRSGRSTEWSRIRFVLHGPVHVRTGAGMVVERAEAFGSPEFRTESGRALTRSSDWLDLYWRNGSAVGDRLPSGVVLRLSTSAFERVERLCEALCLRDVRAAYRAARSLIDELRAQGLPFAREALSEPLAADADAASRQFAQVVEQLVGQLSLQPMAVDLSRSLDVCERQALRRARQHFQRFYLSASSWREFLSCVRIEMGAFFMSAPNARTEDVSCLLGFSSPTSFCHALQDAGLPSPQTLQRELRCT